MGVIGVTLFLKIYPNFQKIFEAFSLFFQKFRVIGFIEVYGALIATLDVVEPHALHLTVLKGGGL